MKHRVTAILAAFAVVVAGALVTPTVDTVPAAEAAPLVGAPVQWVDDLPGSGGLPAPPRPEAVAPTLTATSMVAVLFRYCAQSCQAYCTLLMICALRSESWFDGSLIVTETDGVGATMLVPHQYLSALHPVPGTPRDISTPSC